MYRDSHGRGQRRPTFGFWLPQYRTKSGMFDRFVMNQLRRLHRGWPDLIDSIRYEVEEIPTMDTTPWRDRTIKYSSVRSPRHRNEPTCIILYRRPLEALARDIDDLQLLIREELVVCLSEIIGLRPEEIDPTFHQ